MNHPTPLARRADPATSHAAAELAASFAATHRAAILRALVESRDGLTFHEVAERCGLEAHAVGRRMKELQVQGMAEVLVDGIVEVTRPSPSGRAARVWVATKAGRVIVGIAREAVREGGAQ